MNTNGDFFGTEDVDQSQVDKHSGGVNKPGNYHFQVTDVKPDLSTMKPDGQEKAPCFVLTCQVLHDVEGQSPSGSTLWHNLIVGGKGGGPPHDFTKKMTIAFLTGIGVMKWKEMPNGMTVAVDADTGKPGVTQELIMRCKGRQFVCKIVEDERNTGPKPKFIIPFSVVHQIGSPEAEAFPYNKELAATALKKPVTGFEPAPVGVAAASEKEVNDDF